MQKIPEFTHSIKKARAQIELEYEKVMRKVPAAGIFALKNF
jgi:hypothetical protein